MVNLFNFINRNDKKYSQHAEEDGEWPQEVHEAHGRVDWFLSMTVIGSSASILA